MKKYSSLRKIGNYALNKAKGWGLGSLLGATIASPVAAQDYETWQAEHRAKLPTYGDIVCPEDSKGIRVQGTLWDTVSQIMFSTSTTTPDSPRAGPIADMIKAIKNYRTQSIMELLRDRSNPLYYTKTGLTPEGERLTAELSAWLDEDTVYYDRDGNLQRGTVDGLPDLPHGYLICDNGIDTTITVVDAPKDPVTGEPLTRDESCADCPPCEDICPPCEVYCPEINIDDIVKQLMENDKFKEYRDGVEERLKALQDGVGANQLNIDTTIKFLYENGHLTEDDGKRIYGVETWDRAMGIHIVPNDDSLILEDGRNVDFTLQAGYLSQDPRYSNWKGLNLESHLTSIGVNSEINRANAVDFRLGTTHMVGNYDNLFDADARIALLFGKAKPEADGSLSSPFLIGTVLQGEYNRLKSEQRQRDAGSGTIGTQASWETGNHKVTLEGDATARVGIQKDETKMNSIFEGDLNLALTTRLTPTLDLRFDGGFESLTYLQGTGRNEIRWFAQGSTPIKIRKKKAEHRLAPFARVTGDGQGNSGFQVGLAYHGKRNQRR